MLRRIVVVSLAGWISVTCFAQTSNDGSNTQPVATQKADSESKRFYQLNFVVQELESERVVNSRSYSMIMRGNSERGSIRSGDKVPILTSGTGAKYQWQQLDIGVNIDCLKLEETTNGVSLWVRAEVSNVVENRGDGPANLPVIRENKWEASVAVPIKQHMVLFSSDDPASKKTMQLQLTVTPIR